MLKFPLIISAELFVLIAALFLLVYITKQQVNKWFIYSSVSIIIAVLLIMVCTFCCAICMRHCGSRGMNKECRMETRLAADPMMMGRMHHKGCSEEMMIHKGNCFNEMKECEEGEECEDMPSCKNGMGKGEEHCMKKEIIISEKDSMPKKEVIIKKK